MVTSGGGILESAGLGHQSASLLVRCFQGGIRLGMGPAINQQKAAARVVRVIGFAVVNGLAMMNERIPRIEQTGEAVVKVKALGETNRVAFYTRGFMRQQPELMRSPLIKNRPVSFRDWVHRNPDGQDVGRRLAEVSIILVGRHAGSDAARLIERLIADDHRLTLDETA